MRRLPLIFGLLFIHPSARAFDPQLADELRRVRQMYWDTLTGAHWMTWEDRTCLTNTAAMATIQPSVKMIIRMFGAEYPDVRRGLVGLGDLPRDRGWIGLMHQHESLQKQFAEIDVVLKKATGVYDPSWRKTRFGKEFARLTSSMVKNYHCLDQSYAQQLQQLHEWHVEAEMLARFTPNPLLRDLLLSMSLVVGDMPTRGHAKVTFERMRLVLEALRALEDEMDLHGIGGCEDAFGGKRDLPAPLLALPRPKAS